MDIIECRVDNFTFLGMDGLKLNAVLIRNALLYHVSRRKSWSSVSGAQVSVCLHLLAYAVLSGFGLIKLGLAFQFFHSNLGLRLTKLILDFKLR